jgi:hypothetical protein
MTRHIKPETLAPLSDVDRVVQLLKPKDVEQCRRDIEEAMKWIAKLPPRVAPVTVKKQLDRVTAKVKAVQKAIDALPHGWRMVMNFNAAERLKHIAKHSEEMSASIAAKRSGGSAAVQTSAFKKYVAADQALGLLTAYGDGRRPTTMRGGDFYRIARLLSGQKGNMARACASALSDK